MDVMIGDVECPRCGLDEHVVALEDGVWMCLACVHEFCDDGQADDGRAEARPYTSESIGGNSSHSGSISMEKDARMIRNLTL